MLPLRAVFVQYIQLLSMATVLPSMGAEVLMKTRRKRLLCGCQQEFMFIRRALCLLHGTCTYAEKRRVTEQQVIGLWNWQTTFHDILEASLFNYHISTDRFSNQSPYPRLTTVLLHPCSLQLRHLLPYYFVFSISTIFGKEGHHLPSSFGFCIQSLCRH